MLMGLSDLLELGHTPEEKEERIGSAGTEAFISVILDDRLDYAKWRQQMAESAV